MAASQVGIYGTREL